jgi:hypothetical protein
LLTGTVTEVSK